MHDNGVFILFLKDDLKLRADIKDYSKAYHFSVLKKWTGIKCLPITNTRDASKTVNSSSLIICFILLNTSI